MDNEYIKKLPIPTCTVNPDGIISAANPLMKNVFVYDDIVGTNFFTMTGFKRDQLMKANQEEKILERSGKVFKLWVNEDAKEDAARRQEQNSEAAGKDGAAPEQDGEPQESKNKTSEPDSEGGSRE